MVKNDSCAGGCAPADPVEWRTSARIRVSKVGKDRVFGDGHLVYEDQRIPVDGFDVAVANHGDDFGDEAIGADAVGTGEEMEDSIFVHLGGGRELNAVGERSHDGGGVVRAIL